MCELGKLPMVICSETIETVSLSGASRLQLEPNFSNNTFFAKYKNRVGNENLSLHQYFHYIKNDTQRSSSQKEIVPHYVGGSAICEKVAGCSHSLIRVAGSYSKSIGSRTV